MYRISRIFVILYSIYFAYGFVTVPWLMQPFVVLKNEFYCTTYVHTLPNDKDINMLYMNMIDILFLFSSPYLLLLINVVICKCSLFGIVLFIVLSNSIISPGFIISNIMITKNDLNTTMTISPECYDYTPKYARELSFTYERLYILSIVTTIFWIFTLFASAKLCYMWWTYETRNTTPSRIPLLETMEIKNTNTSEQNESKAEQNEIEMVVKD